MDVLVGLMYLVFGLIVAFAGLRLWFYMLPLLGFFAGLTGGVTLMHWAFDENLFSTFLGLAIGVVFGLIGAALSYLYWYVGALLGASYVGAVSGAGLMRAFSVDSDVAIVLAAVIGAILLVVVAVMLGLPLYMVIVSTAFAGATWAITGAMLTLNVVDRADLGYGTVTAAINESWLWIVAWLVLAVAGLNAQLRTMTGTHLPEDRWERVQPAGGQLAS